MNDVPDPGGSPPGPSRATGRRPDPPVQIPAPPERFVGRRRALERLDHLWAGRQAHRPLAILCGIGGIGKTTVAVRWLTEKRSEFPDGLLYANLSEPDGATPISPNETLFTMLTTLGIAGDDIPGDLSQRSAAFRAATTDRRLGVLLDNAVSAAQVRSLLPATRSTMVLVTSRRRLTTLVRDDAQLLDVGPLGDAEARAVLAESVGPARMSDTTATDEIVAACGGLPLALSVVAARLRARPLRSLAREARAYRRHLREDGNVPEDVRAVQAVLDASYAELNSTAATLYRVCGLHPTTRVELDALAAVVGTTVDEVEDDVETLLDANLVADGEGDSVVQHDVVHQDARRRAERELAPADRTTIAREFTHWYLRRAMAADDVIHPHRQRYTATPDTERPFPDRESATGWWRRSQPTIRAVFAEAANHGWDEEVWQFCEASWGYFLHHRDYGPWLTMNTAGVAAAQRCGEPLIEARLRSQLGFAHAKLGDFAAATEQNLIALKIGREHHHESTQATALSQLGRAARGGGDLEDALGYYRQAAAIHEAAGRQRGVALCRRRCGEVLAKLGRDEEAAAELTAAADAMAQLGDTNQHARAVMTLARLRSRQGRHDVAKKMLSDALEVVTALQSPYYTAEVLTALGEVELEHGDREQGRDLLAQAQELYAGMGDPHATKRDASDATE